MEEEQAADGDEEQRRELQDRRHELHRADVAGAREVGEGGQPLDGERGDDGPEPGAVDRQEHVEVADGGHGEGRVRHPGGDPVRPGGQESGEVAERLARVDVRSAGLGVAAGQAAEDERERDGPDGQDTEGDEADGAVGGDGGREQEDAAADDVAHHEGGGDGEPEAAGVLAGELFVLRGRSRLRHGSGVGHGVLRLSRAGADRDRRATSHGRPPAHIVQNQAELSCGVTVAAVNDASGAGSCRDSSSGT